MKLLFIDVETTGIPVPNCGLIQLAGAIEIDAVVQAQFDYRIRPFPDDEISDEALQVNGISRQELAGYEDPECVFAEFTALLAQYVDRYDRSDKFLLIGFNSQFDADHIRSWFHKNHDPYFGSWFFHPPLDVMNMAAVFLRATRHAMENFKLPTVARALGFVVEEEKTHDALYDVHLTQDLFRHLLQKDQPKES